jgi:hypothetical protein
MKKITPIFILPLLAVVLCGCPFDSPYAIDEQPQIAIDESLIGSWATMVPRPTDDKHTNEQPVKIIFSKKADDEYFVHITGYLNELKHTKLLNQDTIRATAYLSEVGNHRFLNTRIYGKTYLAELIQENNKLSIRCLSEHFTAKFIKSSASLKEALKFHYHTRPKPLYDDWFVANSLQRVK